MPDRSDLDSRYFIDNRVYACPFCNRRNVTYRVIDKFDFEWTDGKECHAYAVSCSSCQTRSTHLTFHEIGLEPHRTPPYGQRFVLDEVSIDDVFFYSVPTSFFVLVDHMPTAFTQPFAEAERFPRSNYLALASLCVRHIVCELARLHGAEGNDYEERIESLRGKQPDIDPTYFDTLLTIPEMKREQVHKQVYDDREAEHLRLILATINKILMEIYVIQELRKKERKGILGLNYEILGGQAESKAESPDGNEDETGM